MNQLSLIQLKDLEKKTLPLITEAGEYIVNHWNSISTITYKDKRDVVSNIDVEVERTLRSKLHDILPEAGFIVEEGVSEKKQKYNWTIDPLDQTKNYIHNIPMFVTQIALLDEDEPILGLVYNPISKQMFIASKNNGCFVNGKKIVAKTESDLSSAIIDFDFGSKDTMYKYKSKLLLKVMDEAYRVRMTAGFLSIFSIFGGVDGCIDTATLLSSLTDNAKYAGDLAPHIIIIREAGLRAEFVKVDLNHSAFVVGNANLFTRLSELVRT